MTDEPFRRHRHEEARTSPVEVIMMGLFGLAVAVTLGVALSAVLATAVP